MSITHGVVIGYHGCTHSVAERIFRKKNSYLSVSKNDYDWIGHGIYFWENDYLRAYKWAELSIKRKALKYATPAVVGAIILPNHCLDLTSQEYIDIVRDKYRSYKSELDAVGITEENMPKNEEAHSGDTDLLKRHLDCQVINYLHNNMQSLGEMEFDSVRAAFLEGEGIFKGSKLLDKTHIQWAIRNPEKCILGYFRPMRKL